jgi:hypothetical protein
VPEAILHKRDRLTEEEWAIMRAHPDSGACILAPLAALQAVIPLVRYHHERSTPRWWSSSAPCRSPTRRFPIMPPHSRPLLIGIAPRW